MSFEERKDFIERIKISLTAGDAELVMGMMDFNEWLQLSVQEKSISINRLQKIFGKSSEKRKKKKQIKVKIKLMINLRQLTIMMLTNQPIMQAKIIVPMLL